jgi:hypothetical protein
MALLVRRSLAYPQRWRGARRAVLRGNRGEREFRCRPGRPPERRIHRSAYSSRLPGGLPTGPVGNHDNDVGQTPVLPGCRVTACLPVGHLVKSVPSSLTNLRACNSSIPSETIRSTPLAIAQRPPHVQTRIVQLAATQTRLGLQRRGCSPTACGASSARFWRGNSRGKRRAQYRLDQMAPQAARDPPQAVLFCTVSPLKVKAPLLRIAPPSTNRRVPTPPSTNRCV